MKRIMTILALFLASVATSSAQFKYTIPFPAPLKPATDTVEIFLIGDVMMHSRQLEYDCSSFLSHISPRMRQADFCIANMEFPLGGKPYSGYPAFSAPDWYADYIAQCGANVFLLANNHVLDKGHKGLVRTVSYYDRMCDSLSLSYTGVDGKPLILEKHGIKIGIVNFTYGTNMKSTEGSPSVNVMDREQVHKAIESARAQGADFIVAIPHWGTEYELHHNSTQENWASWLADEGCSIVVGGHPHVVQDSTHVKGVPVIYSVGNAVSNMSARDTRLELAVTMRFVRERESGEKLMLEPQLDFMWCTLPGMLTDSYATILVKEWANRRSDWLTPSDFDNMVETWKRVKASTGIEN